ncbi:MAG: adenosylmethionine decarboxylase [Candidatus Micrarchaeota archaeon]
MRKKLQKKANVYKETAWKKVIVCCECSMNGGKKKMYGPHLTLDMYGCEKKKLESVDFVSKFLDGLPKKIGMTKIIPPYVFRYEGIKPEDWGVSGIVLIAESHISIHTYPEKNYASFDVFSCKEFDIKKVEQMVVEMFDAKTYEKNSFERGRHFPKGKVRNKQLLAMQRVQRKAVEEVKVKK